MQEVLNTFSKSITNNPLLNKTEELNLTSLIKKGNKKAREKLIESNYRLVLSISKKYYKPGKTRVSFDDITQEAAAGLIKAVDRFNPDLGFKFSTYACWWIKQAVLQYINENSSVIKVPTHSRLLAAKIKNAIEEYKAEFMNEPTEKEICDLLCITPEMLNTTLKANDSILSIESDDDCCDDEANSKGLISKISDSSMNPEQELLHEESIQNIKQCLALLTKREEKIIRLRFGIQENSTDYINFPITNDEIERLKND